MFIPVPAAGAPTPPPILEQGVADHGTHINVVAARAGTSNEGGFRVSSDQPHALGDRLVVADRRPRTLRETALSLREVPLLELIMSLVLLGGSLVVEVSRRRRHVRANVEAGRREGRGLALPRELHQPRVSDTRSRSATRP